MGHYLDPALRPLRVYAFDPSLGRNLNNYMTVNVPFERLKRGPVGEKIAVIDYDISNDCWYEPVDLDHPSVTINNGLEPSESDPRFHQQMVYAVASETVHRFEFALGRGIRWRRAHGRKNDPLRKHLRIFPHAFQQANAFYDPHLKAVLFGYFRAVDADAGGNLPGQTVFTCLSHDIIAHEVTHAILDGLREHFSEATSVDTPAFHEAFADIVALFQHFSIRDALIDTIRRTGGQFYRAEIEPDAKIEGKPQISANLALPNPLVELGRQFGEAMGTRKALRSALGTPPNAKAIETAFEPHTRGAILVAAVFDAYFTIYVKRTRDLLRIARASGAIDGERDLHPDLAERLCREATKTAEHILNICIRAVDYCPPVDIQFGEFLRAMITADSDLVPSDPWNYRGEIIKAFRLRGIVPEEVNSYSEESLRWRGPQETNKVMVPFTGLQYDPTDASRKVTLSEKKQLKQQRYKSLHSYAKRYASAFGLAPPRSRIPIQAYSSQPIFRIGPDGRLNIDFIVQFLQHRVEKIDPDEPDSGTFNFRGGSTVIFDQHGRVRYVVEKRITNKQRLARQRAYQAQCNEISAFATYDAHGQAEPLNFAAIHRGF
jgi:hypothetical protein